MPKTTQLVLTLDSKPGVLAKVARTLADAGVNIVALSAPEATGRGKVRLVVSDAERAKAALKEAKYRVAEEAALSLTLENRSGALAAITEKLAGAKVNIKSLYATTAGTGTATVVMTVANVEKAQSVIG
jgi:hypothetical protein